MVKTTRNSLSFIEVSNIRYLKSDSLKRPLLSLLNAFIPWRILGALLLVLSLTGSVQAQTKKDSTAKEEEITDWTICESSFPSPQAYINQNLKYPEQARINGIKGTVIIKFHIEADGSLSNLQLEKSLSPECNEEVVRVFRRAPRWEPQDIDGKRCRVAMVATVYFSPERVNIERLGPVQVQTHTKEDSVLIAKGIMHVIDYIEPQFPNYLKYIKTNLRYPEKAKKDGTMGSVILLFTVEVDGSLSNFKIEKSLSPECDAEALRLFQSMPRWSPGEDPVGTLVRVKCMATVKFDLNSQK